MILMAHSSITLNKLLPKKSVCLGVVFEFSESFLDDPDGTFLYYTKLTITCEVCSSHCRYEFSESFLDDSDGTFLYYSTVSLRYIQPRINAANPQAISWIHTCILS